MELARVEWYLAKGDEEHAVALVAKDAVVATKLATAREDVERALVTAQ